MSLIFLSHEKSLDEVNLIAENLAQILTVKWKKLAWNFNSLPRNHRKLIQTIL